VWLSSEEEKEDSKTPNEDVSDSGEKSVRGGQIVAR
jgi:hypothetical protein